MVSTSIRTSSLHTDPIEVIAFLKPASGTSYDAISPTSSLSFTTSRLMSTIMTSAYLNALASWVAIKLPFVFADSKTYFTSLSDDTIGQIPLLISAIFQYDAEVGLSTQ